MHKEIDILLKAVSKSCMVVEKATNVLWDEAELLEARTSGQFQAEECLHPPSSQSGVSSPFPGCLQQAGGATTAYHLVGQTEHFVIFAPSHHGAAQGSGHG